MFPIQGGQPAGKLYVDDVFSAYTYTGNGSTQTITNGIDLAGEGGLVWTKRRNSVQDHGLADTARGTGVGLATDLTNGNFAFTGGVTSFNSDGYSLGNDGIVNGNTNTYVGWTFRNAPNFYHHEVVVKSAGSNATFDFSMHTAGLGMVRVKRTDSTGSWYIWHRSLTAGKLLIGETTAAEATLGHITVSGTTVTLVNGVIADGTYLVEAWAHDTSADGIIQCGEFTCDAFGDATVSLGWETQCLEIKTKNQIGAWEISDVSRGAPVLTGSTKLLNANDSSAESTGYGLVPIADGFRVYSKGNTSYTYIYLAIRRPNKPPTSGTQVYNAIARTGTGATATVTGVGFAPDLVTSKRRDSTATCEWQDRLRGATKGVFTSLTIAEATTADTLTAFNMDGASIGVDASNLTWNVNTATYINHFFRRATGVFDMVCDTGTAANKLLNHNLGVPAEFIIRKKRSAAGSWYCYHSAFGPTKFIALATNSASTSLSTAWNDTAPTATTFSIGSESSDINTNGATYVNYLFATMAGISKVGSYTGNGSTQTIDCGFTTGARFVLIHQDSASTTYWYLWDSVRGIVAGNDPHLALDTTSAEVTTDDSIDPDNSGFIVNQLAATNINVNAATYIFLALA